MKFLSRLTQNLLIAIPVTLLLGFLYGLYFPTEDMKWWVTPLTVLMVYPMMVNLKIAKLFEGGDSKAQLAAQLLNFGVIPFVAFGLGQVFFPAQPFMATGFLLAALLPTSGMTISWTGFAKGNLNAAIKMTVLGLVLGALATPLYLQWLMGTQISIDLKAVFMQILVIVFIPMAAGHLTQTFLIKKCGQKGYQTDWAPKFPPFSTLGVLGIAFVAMALKAQTIAARPDVLLIIAVPLLLLYGLNYGVSTVIAKLFLPRGDAIALVYGTVMRNLSIALALAMNVFGEAGSDAALVITLAYIIQVQSAAWYVRFSDRLFGKAAEAPKP